LESVKVDGSFSKYQKILCEQLHPNANGNIENFTIIVHHQDSEVEIIQGPDDEQQID
jgi:hypothetical protein